LSSLAKKAKAQTENLVKTPSSHPHSLSYDVTLTKLALTESATPFYPF